MGASQAECAMFVLLSELYERQFSRLTLLLGQHTGQVQQVTSRLLIAVDMFLPLYFSWSGWHCLVSATAVGVGRADPEQWPPLFGRPSDAYTLRRFWRYENPQPL